MFKIKNRTTYKISVCFAYYDGVSGTWTSEGWWNIEPFDSTVVYSKKLTGTTYYFYGHSYGHEETKWIWSGEQTFQTDPVNAFKIHNADKNCDSNCLMFRKVDVGNMSEFTYTLFTNDLYEANQTLNNMIGMQTVKDFIERRIAWLEVQLKRKANGIDTPPIRLHLVFKGNPGTGKTSIARIFGKIYKAMGLLSKGHVIEVDGRGLVAEYIGQTASKTNQIVDQALDGVLFIDEAYALTPADSSKDFGQEVVATLLKRMEDDKERLAVIVAGYVEDMDRFLLSNLGLKSRFTTELIFDDYKPDELMQILNIHIRQVNGVLDSDLERRLLKLFNSIYLKRDQTFSNARLVENLFQKMDEMRAVRVTKNGLDPLKASYTYDDLPREYWMDNIFPFD